MVYSRRPAYRGTTQVMKVSVVGILTQRAHLVQLVETIPKGEGNEPQFHPDDGESRPRLASQTFWQKHGKICCSHQNRRVVSCDPLHIPGICLYVEDIGLQRLPVDVDHAEGRVASSRSRFLDGTAFTFLFARNDSNSKLHELFHRSLLSFPLDVHGARL